MSPAPTASPPSRAGILLAFAAVYLVWGSTYLAIRVAVAGIPPFLMAGTRFVASAALLFPFLLRRGDPRLTPRQWLDAGVVGCLLMLGGNGLVVWAEQVAHSGQTALFIASTPVWFTVFEWFRPGGSRPGPLTWLGIALGFAGVSTLAMGRSHDTGSPGLPQSLALLAATLCWAGGSTYARHAAKPASALMGAAAQMLVGGVAMLAVGLLRGELQALDPAAIPTKSWLALGYLVAFGSLVGYTAYVHLLRHCTAAQVSTYAYVNPVVAVLLGALVLGESLGPRVRIAGALVVGGVVLLTVPSRTWYRLFSRIARGLPFNPARS